MKKYKWALVHSKTGQLLRADSGRRALFKTRERARLAKWYGDDFGRFDLLDSDIKIVRRTFVK